MNLDCLLPQCDYMLTDKHLKSVFGQGGYCAVPFIRPHFMFIFFSPYITWMWSPPPPWLFLPLCTGTTTIQPVHSGGCHSNKAASLSPSFVQCLPIVWASQTERRCGFCMQIEPLIEPRSDVVNSPHSAMAFKHSDVKWDKEENRWIQEIHTVLCKITIKETQSEEVIGLNDMCFP